MTTDPKPGHLFITKPSRGGLAGALCRVLRVTPTRLYVAVENWGGAFARLHSAIIAAYSNTPYVDRDNVFAGPVTVEEYAAYLSAHNAREAAIDAATKAANEEYAAKISRIFGEEPRP